MLVNTSFCGLLKRFVLIYQRGNALEKKLDTNINAGIVFMGEIPANVQFSFAFINVELRNNICIIFHVLQKVSCFCAGVITENLPLYCS